MDLQKFICDVCGAVLSRKDNLLKHKKSHETEEESVTCDTCGKVLKNKYSLNNHKKLHSSESYRVKTPRPNS